MSTDDQPWPPAGLTQAEIERGWVGSKPPSPYRVYGRFLAGTTRVISFCQMIAAACFFTAALADKLLRLGWGYRWGDLIALAVFAALASLV